MVSSLEQPFTTLFSTHLAINCTGVPGTMCMSVITAVRINSQSEGFLRDFQYQSAAAEQPINRHNREYDSSHAGGLQRLDASDNPGMLHERRQRCGQHRVCYQVVRRRFR